MNVQDMLDMRSIIDAMAQLEQAKRRLLDLLDLAYANPWADDLPQLDRWHADAAQAEAIIIAARLNCGLVRLSIADHRTKRQNEFAEAMTGGSQQTQ